MYTGEELKPDYYSERDRKVAYLTKIISLVEEMDGSKIQAMPQKIVAGLEPELTNLLLQSIHKCASSGKSSDPYVKKVLGGGGEEPDTKVEKKNPRPPSARVKKEDKCEVLKE